MKLATGDMFTSPYPDLLLFTGNSTIKQNGALVMGRGAALQAKTLFPGIDLEIGKEITAFRSTYHSEQYGMLVSPQRGEPALGVFQVKFHYKSPADLGLILFSVETLQTYLRSRPSWKVRMNFPGTGCGRIPRQEVFPIISALPDSVTVWEYPE